MEQKKELSFSERLIWALGQSTGRQFITAMVSTYILVFLTDTFGIAAGAAGVIMTLATIWDAINDPILGTLADRTKSRWGTYRPYLLFVPLPLSVVATLLFAAPALSASGKVAYAAVLYICYGMLVTCIEIPYNALLPTMTKNEMERNDTISLSTFVASVVIMIVTSFTPDLVNIFGGENPSRGYMIVVLIGAVCMCVTSWLAFAKCKERYTIAGKSVPAIFVITAIGSAFATMTNAFRPMTVVGMTDFVLEKTGNQLNGTLSAIGGFSYKCGTAISNAIIAGMLAATGYIAGAIGQEPEAFMTGINAVRFLVPFIATVLYIVLIQFYPEKKRG